MIPNKWVPGLVKLGRSKRPIEDEWNKAARARWAEPPDDWEEEIRAHWKAGGGLGMVPPPGVVILDCDNVEAVAYLESIVPDGTPIMYRTPESAHFYLSYKLPPDALEWKSKGCKLRNGARMDLRVHGKSQAVVPPTEHADGQPYTWLTPLPTDPSEVPRMPKELMDVLLDPELRMVDGVGGEVPTGENAHDTVRDHIFSLANVVGSLEELRKLGEEFARAYVQPSRPERYDQMLAGPELDDLIEGAWRLVTEEGPALPRMQAMGHGMVRYARAWHEYFDEQWAYVGEWSARGEWVAWDGETWSPRSTIGEDGFSGASLRFADCLDRLRRTDLPTLPDHEDFTATMAVLAGTLYNEKKCEAGRKALREGLAEPGDNFDQSHHLWSCPSYDDHKARTFNFQTGEAYLPRAEDRVTYVGGAPYIRGRVSSIWDGFIRHAIPDDTTREWVQRLAGYTMMGDASEDVVPFFIGVGGSGKSTLIGALQAVFGAYHSTVQIADIDDNSRATGSGGANASILALKGARMASCTELPETVRLGNKMKSLTGGDEQSPRGLYAKVHSSFQPRFVLWLGGNLQPRASAIDTGLARRLRYIPMDSPPAKPDPRVRDALRHDKLEMAAVLNWCIEGAYNYLQRGLSDTPPEVQARGDRAVMESSALGEWASDCLEETDPTASITSTEGLDHYRDWYRGAFGNLRGCPVRSVVRFGQEMAAIGYRSEKVRQGKKTPRVFKGLKFKSID